MFAPLTAQCACLSLLVTVRGFSILSHYKELTLHLYRNSLGDLVSGAFPVPDNPILLKTAQETGLHSLGDLVAASFPIPQNPITGATSMDTPKVLTQTPRNALVRSLTAARKGAVSNAAGMGDATSALTSIGTFLDQNTLSTDWPNWYFVLGGAALLVFLTGGKSGPNRLQRMRGGSGPSGGTLKR